MDITTERSWGISDIGWSEVRALGRSSVEGRCLNRLLDQALSACEPSKRMRNGRGQTGVFYDDCVAAFFRGNTDQGFYGFKFPSPVQGSRRVVWEERPQYSQTGKYLGTSREQVILGHLFMDQNCNSVVIDDLDLVQQCLVARLDYAGSPISIILDPSYYVEDSTIVNFSLDPVGCPGCVSEWKASSSAPLLVFDPSHTGVITDASQLFGNWTFGGNRLASLASGSLQESRWEHGFKALATLDTNFDGKISGEELKNLGAWFDKNRNGISEAGEVLSLEKIGINTLYYKNSKADVFGNMVLELGYDREVEGGKVSGSLVDWYGKVANNAQQLLSNTVAANVLKHNNSRTNFADSINSLKNNSSLDNVVSVADVSKINIDIDGSWDWIGVLADGTSIGGTLILRNTDGVVAGYSFAETSVKVRNEKMSFINVVPVYGKQSDSGIDFHLAGTNDTVHSSVRLNQANNQLEGKTKVNAGEKNMEYSWVAERKKVIE
ncbi:MAG TPA: hypothetical protein PKA63_13085 [Oligoflexia bacterium]|nr:hypothetical protein [Oligoflexia bacterium]